MRNFDEAIDLLKQLKKDIRSEIRQRGIFHRWTRNWPDYCEICLATGVIHWTENGAPHGAGYWPMPMSELCENCSGQGLCPRCRKIAIYGQTEFDDGPCPECGWNWGKNTNDHLPSDGLSGEYWDLMFDKIDQLAQEKDNA